MASQPDQDHSNKPNNNDNNQPRGTPNNQPYGTNDKESNEEEEEEGQGRGHEQEQARPSYRNRPPPPLATPNQPVTAAATASYPSPMCHPSAMGYLPPAPPPSPGYHPAYPPPPPPLPHNYPYASHAYAHAPPAPYFYNNVNYQNYPHVLQTPSLATGFLRGFLAVIIVVTIVSFVLNGILLLFFNAYLPTFHVDTFSVSNFNASSPSSFTSTWDITLSITNPNQRIKIYLEEGESYVRHGENDVLASFNVQPFSIDTKTTKTVELRLTANNTGLGETQIVNEAVVNALNSEFEHGSVVFNFKMDLLLSFDKQDQSFYKVQCQKLKVGFENASSGNGKLLGNGNCDIWVE